MELLLPFFPCLVLATLVMVVFIGRTRQPVVQLVQIVIITLFWMVAILLMTIRTFS